MHKSEFKKRIQKKMKVLAKKFSPCRLSQNIIFCHKTHFCGRYSAPDLRQTGGPCVQRGHFCPLIWYSQACIGLVTVPNMLIRKTDNKIQVTLEMLKEIAQSFKSPIVSYLNRGKFQIGLRIPEVTNNNIGTGQLSRIPRNLPCN